MVTVILLVATYNQAKLLPTFFYYLYRLDPQPQVTVFAENNSSDDTLNLLTRFKRPKEIIRLWFRRNAVMTTQNRYEVIAHVRQLLLTRARQLSPDFAVFLDSDVLPLDAALIEKLVRHKLDVVGGPYLRRFPWGVYLATIWRDGNRLRSWSVPQQPLDEVELTSAGCLCLSNRVIRDRRINFYPMYSQTASEDFGYCRQARKNGYKIWLDGTINLKHQTQAMQKPKPWTKAANGTYLPFFYD